MATTHVSINEFIKPTADWNKFQPQIESLRMTIRQYDAEQVAAIAFTPPTVAEMQALGFEGRIDLYEMLEQFAGMIQDAEIKFLTNGASPEWRAFNDTTRDLRASLTATIRTAQTLRDR